MKKGREKLLDFKGIWNKNLMHAQCVAAHTKTHTHIYINKSTCILWNNGNEEKWLKEQVHTHTQGILTRQLQIF